MADGSPISSQALQPICSMILLRPRTPDRTIADGKLIIMGASVLANPWEQSLTVVAVGPEVDDIHEGDEVMIEVYKGQQLSYGSGKDDRLVLVPRKVVSAKLTEGEVVKCDATGSW